MSTEGQNDPVKLNRSVLGGGGMFACAGMDRQGERKSGREVFV